MQTGLKHGALLTLCTYEVIKGIGRVVRIDIK